MEEIKPKKWNAEDKGHYIDFFKLNDLVSRLHMGNEVRYELFSGDENNSEVMFFSYETPPFGFYVLKENEKFLPIRPLDIEEVRNFVEILGMSLDGSFEGAKRDEIVKQVLDFKTALEERIRIFESKKEIAKKEKAPEEKTKLFIEISAFLGFESVGLLKNRILELFRDLEKKGEVALGEQDELNEFFYFRVVRGDRYIYELEEAFGIKFIFDQDSFGFRIKKM